MNDLLLMSELGMGLFTFILGLCVVFFGMIVIVLSVNLAGRIIHGKETKKEEKPVKEVPTSVEAPTAPVVEEGVPEHVRVAIIAAIAAYYESGNAQPNHEFKVRKIKKLNR